MAGSADGPSRGRPVEQPPGDPRSEVDGAAHAADAERPVALLVGDGRIDPHELARRLEPHFEIIPTTDLPTALAVIADRRLDFVMVDAALPDPAMIELVAQARVRQWLRDLPIICYGAVAGGPIVSRLAGAAAHDIILEPVSTDELVARITLVLSPAR